jgi:hypothetical protein
MVTSNERDRLRNVLIVGASRSRTIERKQQDPKTHKEEGCPTRSTEFACLSATHPSPSGAARRDPTRANAPESREAISYQHSDQQSIITDFLEINSGVMCTCFEEALGVLDLLQKLSRRRSAHLVGVLINGRQRRVEIFSDLFISTSDERSSGMRRP